MLGLLLAKDNPNFRLGSVFFWLLRLHWQTGKRSRPLRCQKLWGQQRYFCELELCPTEDRKETNKKPRRVRPVGRSVPGRVRSVFFVVCGRHGRLKRLVYGYIVNPGLVSASTIEVILLRRLGLLGKLPTNVRISGQELSGCWAQGCHGGGRHRSNCWGTNEQHDGLRLWYGRLKRPFPE